MRIKICGLFREQDIDYVNEALPDYAGFVFAESRRQVSPEFAKRLRSRLADSITPVGVFVNAPISEIAALYNDGVISIAQLHGNEDDEYIKKLKDICGVPVIKVIKFPFVPSCLCVNSSIEYLLIDSGAGTGKTFDWNLLSSPSSLFPLPSSLPWFLAGGINLDNIEQAMALNPFAIDVSSGAETDGIKDRQKILQLTSAVRVPVGSRSNKGNKNE
jgi:phosphoribosylanthranilate isomerase